jgi:hypothetical protein
MWFLSPLIMMVSIESFYRQHTRRCDWETFENHEKFLDQVQRKWDKLGKRMMYERKQQMHEKYLKVQPRWFLGQLRESWICFTDATMELWTTYTMSTIRPWRTGDRTISNILLSGFGTNIILIWYVTLSSQGMSSGLRVWQGRSS